MLRTEKRIRPAEEQTFLVGLTCDLCGSESARGDVHWPVEGCSFMNINRVVVKHESGYTTGDGTERDIKRFDICPTCFEAKLVPWLESQGAQPRVENREY